MNILVFSWRDPKHPLAGGAEQVMHEHMKGWVKAGHNVTFFSSRFPGSLHEEELDGIKIIRRGSDLFLGVQLAGIRWYLFGSHDKFDLVIDEFHGYPFFTPLYIRTKKLAVLQEVTREVWFLNYLPRPWNWLVGFVGYITEPLVFLFYKSVPFMTGSESAKVDLQKMGISEKSITIVPHGILFPKKIDKTKKENTRTTIFLGALTRDKGIENALRACALLAKNGKYKFWVVGRGTPEYTAYLRKLAQKLEIEKQTKFWGFVDIEQKFYLLGHAHVLINPSIREGWGLVNIEANRAGTPVVAYQSPGLVDSVKDGQSGIICKVNTPKNLSQEVKKVLSNSQTYKRFQDGARRWASQFNWEKSKKASLKLVGNMI